MREVGTVVSQYVPVEHLLTRPVRLIQSIEITDDGLHPAAVERHTRAIPIPSETDRIVGGDGNLVHIVPLGHARRLGVEYRAMEQDSIQDAHRLGAFLRAGIAGAGHAFARLQIAIIEEVAPLGGYPIGVAVMVVDADANAPSGPAGGGVTAKRKLGVAHFWYATDTVQVEHRMAAWPATLEIDAGAFLLPELRNSAVFGVVRKNRGVGGFVQVGLRHLEMRLGTG